MKDAGTRVDAREEDSRRVPRRGIEDTVRLGREIYERDIRHKVEPEHIGKIVAIDVDSGCWALGDDPVVPDEEVAIMRLREQKLEAMDTYCERVGYQALRSFGAWRQRKKG